MTKRRTILLLAAAAMLAIAATPLTAQAAWRGGWGGGWHGGGWGFGFIAPPLYVGPPAYYYAPPPVYYAPPPGYYAPPPGTYTPGAAPTATSCDAGPYVCPLAHATPIDSPCTCPTGGSRVVAGQAR